MFKEAILALEDGSIFRGLAFGAPGVAVGEVVFNTSLSGYQEILTDPSYARQLVCLTSAHVGNVGVNAEDMESANVHAEALILRSRGPGPSNWRARGTLDEFLREEGKPGIEQIDTRQLTRRLREHGALAGCLATDLDPSEAVARAREFPGLLGMDLAASVSCAEPYEWIEPLWGREAPSTRWRVVVFDFGVKRNILRSLVTCGCVVQVVPARTPPERVLEGRPDGVILTNGPGDPAATAYAIDAARSVLAGGVPVLGICLGHQLLALASGARTIKMKFGHHGANHPVLDLATKQVWISSQNHGFSVDAESLPPTLVPTHVSLFDGSLQGVARTDVPALAFQGHPEASPGPHDVHPIFERFARMMESA